MKAFSKVFALSAAIAGPMAGATPAMYGSVTPSGASVSAGALAHPTAGFADKDKHACKGQNSCKGKGGCKAGDNGCKSKNSCKGKGGCATDGSKPSA